MLIHINTGKNIVTYRRPVMKSFKQYITELFDSPVKVKKIQTIGSHHHVYMFRVNNIPYHVHVHHMFSDKGKADVDFGDRTEKPEDSMTTTGKQGSSASAVFAGVHKALRMHQKENPHINTYTFDASNEKSGDVNPARKKLYGAMVRRVGGKQYGNSFKIPASALREEVIYEMKRPRWEVPAEPGSVPAPEGKIKLYHQTGERNLNSIRRTGLQLSKAKGYEGPKAIYATPPDSKNRGFYGPAHNTPTAEFNVDKDEYTAPFVRRDEVPAKDITAHKEWHSTVRYIDADPNLRKAVENGEHDDLMKQGKHDKFAKAVRFVKKRAAAQKANESFDPEAVKIANSTSRNSGAVGAKAITPRYVEQIANKSHKILDFGSGKDAAHAKRLRQQGLNVTAHEFGSNQNENHDKDALNRQYDHVYASNVLNVQSSKPMMAATLDQIHKATKKGGSFIGNFPMAPRKADDIDANHVEAELNKRFETVKRVGGTKKAPLFHAINPK